VSRQFLYTHTDLRAEIERLRSEPTPALARQSREHASHESIRTRLRVALDENKRLREEIAALAMNSRSRTATSASSNSPNAASHEREPPRRVTTTN
jgi:hypothetical protein